MSKCNKIISVSAIKHGVVRIECDKGEHHDVDLLSVIKSHKAMAPLKNKKEFKTVQVGLWGHSVEWDCGLDLGADRLFTMASNQLGDSIPVEEFHRWREENDLTYQTAAEALGISRRMVAYYESGEKPIPVTIGLACAGWSAIKYHEIPKMTPINDDCPIKLTA